jgi:cell division protein FtsB
VNKVIVEKNQFEINGNTVLAPDESFRKRKYEDLEKSRKQTEQNKKLKNIKKKKNVLKNILLSFVIGMTIIARYCMIYNYQDTISKSKAEMEVLNKENEAYKVELIKFRNISYIEEIATTKLHMVKPKISDIQYCNLSKDNLETKENTEVKISNHIISKIKEIIF